MNPENKVGSSAPRFLFPVRVREGVARHLAAEMARQRGAGAARSEECRALADAVLAAPALSEHVAALLAELPPSRETEARLWTATNARGRKITFCGVLPPVMGMDGERLSWTCSAECLERLDVSAWEQDTSLSWKG